MHFPHVHLKPDYQRPAPGVEPYLAVFRIAANAEISLIFPGARTVTAAFDCKRDFHIVKNFLTWRGSDPAHCTGFTPEPRIV